MIASVTPALSAAEAAESSKECEARQLIQDFFNDSRGGDA